jgi:hypothetical protein
MKMAMKELEKKTFHLTLTRPSVKIPALREEEIIKF